MCTINNPPTLLNSEVVSGDRNLADEGACGLDSHRHGRVGIAGKSDGRCDTTVDQCNSSLAGESVEADSARPGDNVVRGHIGRVDQVLATRGGGHVVESLARSHYKGKQ